jgi:hypothetical protein
LEKVRNSGTNQSAGGANIKIIIKLADFLSFKINDLEEFWPLRVRDGVQQDQEVTWGRFIEEPPFKPK